MIYWTFKTFINGHGRDEFKAWYDARTKKEQAKIDRLISHLKITKIWGRPYSGKLHGYDELFELIIELNNVQWRPIGFYGPGKNEFTILTVAMEKGSKFEPKDAPDKAERRCRIVLNDKEGRCIKDYE